MRLEFLSAMPLITLLMSSCSWHTNQIFYNMGHEGSYLKAQECKFWQVDDTLYVEATLHHYKNRAGNIVSCMGKGSALMSFNAEGSSPRTGYGEITLRQGEHGTYWQRTGSPWLSQKPAGAVPYLNKTGYCSDREMTLYTDAEMNSICVINAESPQATAHALYAYPLSALSLVAVDIPATVAVGAAMMTGTIVTAPVFFIMSQISDCPSSYQQPQENINGKE